MVKLKFWPYKGWQGAAVQCGKNISQAIIMRMIVIRSKIVRQLKPFAGKLMMIDPRTLSGYNF